MGRISEGFEKAKKSSVGSEYEEAFRPIHGNLKIRYFFVLLSPRYVWAYLPAYWYSLQLTQLDLAV